MLVLSIMNGGKACHCLSRSVYHFIVDKPYPVTPTIDDVPNPQTRDILSKV